MDWEFNTKHDQTIPLYGYLAFFGAILIYLSLLLFIITQEPLEPRLILGFGLFLISIIASLLFILYYRRAVASLAWPTVEGEIITSKSCVLKFPGQDQHGRSVTGAYLYPQVEYAYNIGETRVISDRIKLKIWYSQTEWKFPKVDAVLSQYPLGKRVLVYYNPNKPIIKQPNAWIRRGAEQDAITKRKIGNAVLEPGYVGNPYIPLLICTILIVFATILLLIL